MQIPSNSSDPFINSMSEKSEKIRILFLEHIKNQTKKVPLKVMLGDGTVTDQESFDPLMVRKFYENILRNISDWTNQGVSVVTDKDLRRTFIKFEITEGNYIISSHMSLQYHSFLFYKPDHRVIEIQKELAELSDKIKEFQEKIRPQSDKMIEEKLKEKGYVNMDQQKLFEVFFDQEEITTELTKSLEDADSKINDLIKRRDSLFRELDNMLIEIYHTNPVIIDEMKMISAEEGCLCNFNLEYKNNSGDKNFNPSRIPTKIKVDLLKRLDDLIKVLEF